MRCTQAILTATVVMGVAACSQDSPTSMYGRSATVSSNNSHTTSSIADTSDFQLQASRQPIPVMVEGSAFGLDRTTLERTVTGNMQGANWGPMARFTPASQVEMQKNGHPYSVVMLLNPEQTAGQQVTGAQLCSDSVRVGMAGPSSSTSDRSNTGMGATSGNYDSSTGSSGSMSSPPSGAATATSNRSMNSGNIHLVSALCHYDQNVNEVDTRAANVSGPNDPAFHNLIVTTTNELTQPSAQPVEHGEGQ